MCKPKFKQINLKGIGLLNTNIAYWKLFYCVSKLEITFGIYNIFNTKGLMDWIYHYR